MRTWTVDDVMTRAVVSVDPGTSCQDVVDLLVDHGIGAVPVVDCSGRVAGVVSESDLLRRIEYRGAGEGRPFGGLRRRGARRNARADDVAGLMSVPPVVVLAGTSVARAARLMDHDDVKRLPVVDELGRMVGIVSRGDLLKARRRAAERTFADGRM